MCARPQPYIELLACIALGVSAAQCTLVPEESSQEQGTLRVLVTDKPDADRDDLLSYAKDQGIAELMVPKAIHVVGEIPVLGTGKVDYVGIKALLR